MIVHIMIMDVSKWPLIRLLHPTLYALSVVEQLPLVNGGQHDDGGCGTQSLGDSTPQHPNCTNRTSINLLRSIWALRRFSLGWRQQQYVPSTVFRSRRPALVHADWTVSSSSARRMLRCRNEWCRYGQSAWQQSESPPVRIHK